MNRIEDLLGLYNVFGYSQGFNDIVALVPGNFRDILLSPSVDDIQQKHIFPVAKFDLDPNINLNPTQMIGTMETSGITGGTFDMNITFDLPIFIPLHGWVQSSFATLWYLAGLAVYGTPLTIKTKIISYNDTTKTVTIDNIAEFHELLEHKTPYTVNVLDANKQPLTTLQVLSANKRTRSIVVNNSLPEDAKYLVGFDDNPIDATIVQSTLLQPTFLIWSLREGLIGPCLVDSITLTANSEQELTASVKVKALNIQRSFQPLLYDRFSTLKSSFDLEQIIRPVLGSTVRIDLAEGLSGAYGAYQYIGQGLTEGYQTPVLNNRLIYNTTLSIKNNLKADFTADSLMDYPQSVYENAFPSYIYSEGRRIDGSIELYSPLGPQDILEKLVGNGFINSLNNQLSSGLRYNYGGFGVTIPGVVWSPGSKKGDVESEQTSTVNWYAYSKDIYSYPDLEQYES